MNKLIEGITKSVVSDMISSWGIDAIRFSQTISKAYIILNEWDDSYNKINKMIYKINPEKYNKHRVATKNNNYYELQLATAYFVKYKGCLLKIESFRESEKTSLFPRNKIQITFYGKNRFTMRAMFMREILRPSDKTKIKIQNLTENDFDNNIINHSFYNVVLPEDTTKRIIRGLVGWDSSKDWYKEHQLTHKIGVLLHGKPGTGKTTVAKCISNMFNNCPILTIDSNDMIKSIKNVISFRKKYAGNIIVLIEDFDMFFMSREEKEDPDIDANIKKQKMTNMNYLFQMLDGMYSSEDTIYIATTNYVDKLDPALIRHGRFDIQEEFGYFEKEDAIKAAELLGYDESIFVEYPFNKVEFPASPALIQSLILDRRAYDLMGVKVIEY